MKCSRCGCDKSYNFDLVAVPRIDTTPNCYSVFNPRPPQHQLVCEDCLGWRNKNEKNKTPINN